jgi:hypothetical protein
VVGVTWDKKAQKIVLATHKAWRPTRTQPVNLQDVEDYILELRKRHRIVRLYADPYQAMQMLQSLQKKIGETVVQEFSQTVANTTVMGETLFDLIKNRNLIAYADPQMKEHVTNATGVETARGYRLAKEKASKKIDLAVALAMACCAALQAGKPLIFDGCSVPTGVGRGFGAELQEFNRSDPTYGRSPWDVGWPSRLSQGIPIKDYDEVDDGGGESEGNPYSRENRRRGLHEYFTFGFEYPPKKRR